MDTTHDDHLLDDLERSEPAEAADAADRLAAALAAELDAAPSPEEDH